MRGYGRDYDDQQRYLSGGSEIPRDRMRHNPSWEGGNRGYDFGGGYGGGRGGQWGDDWRGGGYSAGGVEGHGRNRDYGRDFNDYGRGDYTYGDFGRQQPMRGRGGGYGGQGRGMQGGQQGGGRGTGRGASPPAGADSHRYGMGDAGMGGYASGGSFTNPTHRGDYFLGYGTGMRRGYSPFW